MTRGRAARGQRGYAAIWLTITMVVLVGCAALAIDVGMWYSTGQRAQKAADAGALSGVPYLPGNPGAAYGSARDYTSRNGFTDGSDQVVVETGLDGQPTRLRVTVTKTVDNVFGGLFGHPTTDITRTAVADFAGPVPMGSPCNEFGNDPESTGKRGVACAGVSGQFWANVAGPASPKSNGDAYQAQMSSNTDFDPNGYFYTVTVSRPVSNLRFEIFDPAMINVADKCDSANLTGATTARNTHVPGTTETTVYANGPSSPYCTGDQRFGGTGEVRTRFQVRSPGLNAWDPLSFPTISGCSKTYNGFDGDLKVALNRGTGATPLAGYVDYVASVFRRWVPICTVTTAQPGEYLVQVNTNGLGQDAASGHNRWSLRAYSTTDSTAKDAISISGRTKMAMYSNQPGATTEFYLARLPSGSAGQILNITLWDIGDSSIPGTVQVKAPPDSGVTFSNCKGSGVTNGNLPTCSIPANSSYNGKLQVISVPIPAGFSCDDTNKTACWVRLLYNYGSGSQPADTTSWTAGIEGDPVRLVE